MRDDEAMAEALQVSAAARRRSAPNPWVGCILVRDGVIVGAGASKPPGGAHAEAVALEQAADRARGATAFVTLEPCSHHGRTPPCADALIEAGVTRVVAALEDPDPRVAGAGLERLRAAGVEVVTGVGADAAARELAPYLHHRRTGRPFVVAKVAMSIDGRIAAADGTSRWITGDAARADAHELRADSQAIVVGAGTAIADQPTLTVRAVEQMPDRQPLRVVLDGRGRVPATGPLFDTELAPTLVITTSAAPADAIDAWRSAGAKVETVAPAATGAGVDLDEVFELLGREGVLQALIEGGSSLTTAVFGRYADRFVVYLAPVALGTNGVPVLAGAGPETMIDATRDLYRLVGARQLGSDARLDYELVH
ncbi:MAG: diaminohydroxyphosphoribosylaminopyrimidine deaminase [Actinomycetota bacterium]|nr:diaminohydroxyphosphoribosylaminopyrimidine deaminase [Actinomycetota bacterium]